MPKLNRPPADRGRPFSPIPYKPAGWGDNDPYAGDLGDGPTPVVYSSYGNPVGPTAERTLFAAAGFEHLNGADAQQASGRYYDHPAEHVGGIITPTSYVFQSGPWPTQPSSWNSGVQLPDWMER